MLKLRTSARRCIENSLFALFVVLGLSSCDEGGRDDSEKQTDWDTGVLGYDPSVPQTCDEVKQGVDGKGFATTVGCEFYSTSLDVLKSNYRFAIVLANVNYTKAASFEIYGRAGTAEDESVEWKKIVTGSIDPLSQQVVEHDVPYVLLNDNMHLYGRPEVKPKGVLRQGAYKVISKIPIVAYQFNPLDRTHSYSSDASALIPIEAWSRNYHVIGEKSVEAIQAGFGWKKVQHNLAYAAIVAAHDDTEVTITPNTELRTGYEDDDSERVVVPRGTDPFTVKLDEADVLYIHANIIGKSLTGTTVTSNIDHPVAVFTGHQCALIPSYAYACDNLEEQLPGLEYWGTKFIAARMPVRNQTSFSDPVLWQIYASEDNTTLTFNKSDSVLGIPFEETTLDKGELLELYVYGSFADPGDFALTADQRIAVLQYMTSFSVTQDEEGESVKAGDPSVAYLPPIEQFLSRYVVNVPNQWALDYLIITRQKNTEVQLDGSPIESELFIPVNEEWEVARIEVSDGPHVIDTGSLHKTVGVTVAGFHAMDSYAFTGGMGFHTLYPPG